MIYIFFKYKLCYSNSFILSRFCTWGVNIQDKRLSNFVRPQRPSGTIDKVLIRVSVSRRFCLKTDSHGSVLLSDHNQSQADPLSRQAAAEYQHSQDQHRQCCLWKQECRRLIQSWAIARDLPCKVKRQYLLTLQVSRYCLLALLSRDAPYKLLGMVSWNRHHSTIIFVKQ